MAYCDGTNATLILAWRMMFSMPVFVLVGALALLLQQRRGLPMPPEPHVFGAVGAGTLGYGLSAYLDFKGLE